MKIAFYDYDSKADRTAVCDAVVPRRVTVLLVVIAVALSLIAAATIFACWQEWQFENKPAVIMVPDAPT